MFYIFMHASVSVYFVIVL